MLRCASAAIARPKTATSSFNRRVLILLLRVDDAEHRVEVEGLGPSLGIGERPVQLNDDVIHAGDDHAVIAVLSSIFDSSSVALRATGLM